VLGEAWTLRLADGVGLGFTAGLGFVAGTESRLSFSYSVTCAGTWSASWVTLTRGRPAARRTGSIPHWYALSASRYGSSPLSSDSCCAMSHIAIPSAGIASAGRHTDVPSPGWYCSHIVGVNWATP
jgi:hypothetical protein